MSESIAPETVIERREAQPSEPINIVATNAPLSQSLAVNITNTKRKINGVRKECGPKPLSDKPKEMTEVYKVAVAFAEYSIGHPEEGQKIVRAMLLNNPALQQEALRLGQAFLDHCCMIAGNKSVHAEVQRMKKRHGLLETLYVLEKSLDPPAPHEGPLMKIKKHATHVGTQLRSMLV